uniref:DSBA domain-containing protein n=1 Tax=Rhabditophanes sp. KR3021 TaxID=114890 RepID=A0AC35TXG2_9BILA
MAKLQIQFFYDIIQPHSFLGFQLLHKLLPSIKSKYEVEIDHLPASIHSIWRTLDQESYSLLPQDTKDAINFELEQMARGFSLDYHSVSINRFKNYEAPGTNTLFLAMIRRERPEVYLKFIEAFFIKTWQDRIDVDRGYKYLKIGQELGLQFKEMDILVGNTELNVNKDDRGKINFLIKENKYSDLPVYHLKLNNKNLIIENVNRFGLICEILKEDNLKFEAFFE